MGNTGIEELIKATELRLITSCNTREQSKRAIRDIRPATGSKHPAPFSQLQLMNWHSSSSGEVGPKPIRAGSVSFLNAEVSGNVWTAVGNPGDISSKNNTMTCTNTEEIYRNQRFWIREAARSLCIWLLNSEPIQLDRRFLWAPLMMGAGGAS